MILALFGVFLVVVGGGVIRYATNIPVYDPDSEPASDREIVKIIGGFIVIVGLVLVIVSFWPDSYLR